MNGVLINGLLVCCGDCEHYPCKCTPPQQIRTSRYSAISKAVHHYLGAVLCSRLLEVSEESNAAYRAGMCVDCKTVPYSAGRPRCDTCHATHIARGGERV